MRNCGLGAHLSMEKLRQARSRADQEEHAPFYVQCEALEKTFQAERPCSCEFHVVVEREVEKVNSHVVACLGALESAAPTSDSELVRCSADCGSVVTFIHCNRNALRELAKEFEEKMLRTTCERCTRASMRTIKTAPFCTSLLERTLDVQARLEESVATQHGVDCSLRRRLTEAYEASAGLSESGSTSVRVTAPAAPCIPRCRQHRGPSPHASPTRGLAKLTRALLAKRSMDRALLPHG